MLKSALDCACLNERRFEAELIEFLSIPSISTEAYNARYVRDAAQFVADKLNNIGFHDVKILPCGETEHPLVIAEWMGAPGKPTVLLYAHYDVQPVDPLKEWVTHPFEPAIRDGKLFARGAADDKGQLYVYLGALISLMAATGELPVNVKILFEGEEECGGTVIKRFVESKPAFLEGVTSVVVLDVGMFAAGLPTVCTGLRGIVTAEVTVTGANRDLHSGEYGGVAPNPAEVLSKLLAGLKNVRGEVKIPNFYCGVGSASIEELLSWRTLPFDEETFKSDLGVAPIYGHTMRISREAKKLKIFERTWARPTLEINGITGGYTGEGFKTIIPSKASAKVSMRLVDQQDPEEIAQNFKDYLEGEKHGCKAEVEILGMAPAVLIDTTDVAISCAAVSFKTTFARDAVYVREGGSIPIVGTFKSVLDVPILVTGFTQPDSRIHSPNESIELKHFHLGIAAMIRYFSLLGDTKPCQ